MKVTVFGCGWLGKQIAEEFIKKGHHVYGNYRSEKGRSELLEIGVEPFYYEVTRKFTDLPETLVSQMDLIIISLPPFDPDVAENYAIGLQNVVLEFEGDVRVIFTSSTGVYPKKDGIFDEDYDFNAGEKLNPLLLAEKGLRAILGDNLLVLRLGGLIGPGRHPIRQLSGKKVISDGSAPLALIDSRDVVALISLLIQENHFGETYNVVFPVEQRKKEYYGLIAKKYRLSPPDYGDQPEPLRKIDSTKLMTKCTEVLTNNILEFDQPLS